MLYSWVSWAMDLLTHLLHYFFIVLPSFFIIPLCLYPLFYPLSLSSRFFLCHEWWSSTFQCMEDGHVPFHFYLMDIGSRSLVEKVILSKRVHVHHCWRVYPFYYVFSKELIYWYLEYAQVKEKKKKCMYTMSFSIEYVYWPLKVFFFFFFS